MLPPHGPLNRLKVAPANGSYVAPAPLDVVSSTAFGVKRACPLAVQIVSRVRRLV